MNKPLDIYTISELDVLQALHEFKKEANTAEYDLAIAFASTLTGKSEDWLYEYVECISDNNSDEI